MKSLTANKLLTKELKPKKQKHPQVALNKVRGGSWEHKEGTTKSKKQKRSKKSEIK